ncbi:alanine racemase [Treponema sp. HNW]|uniref:alanine racemase n=1 Tax=Treponema sp. HNW TaxID=3116654 RepID=UPI003D0F5F80
MKGNQARIYLSNLEHNIRQIKKNIGKAKLCVSVKANAYGHGDIIVARKAVESGADCLAVSSVAEGRRLRDAEIKEPILLFGLTVPEEIPEAVRGNLTPFVCDTEYIDALNKSAASYVQAMRDTGAAVHKFPVHLKIDTGMGRIGCKSEDAAFLASYINRCENLYLAGMCTHLCVSDSLEPEDIEYTQRQIRLFRDSVEAVKKAGINPGILHCSASGGTLMYPNAVFDMVRTGILVYGYFPSEQAAECRTSFNLKPVMELTASVVGIKTVEKGDSVSYGRTWTAAQKTRIATLGIGYGDGIPRRLCPGLHVNIRGKNYPVVGRICMDQCMVDIGLEDEIERWDDAYIFGCQKNCCGADEVAKIADMISYEILTGISARVPRIIVP